MNERTKETLDFNFGQLYKGVLEPDYVYAHHMHTYIDAFLDALYYSGVIEAEEMHVYRTEAERVYYQLVLE